MSFTAEQIATITEAAETIQSACEYRYEKYTQYSCTDRQSWSHEQRCRYGCDSDYELSLKLLKMIE